jgi:hypothetical protein
MTVSDTTYLTREGAEIKPGKYIDVYGNILLGPRPQPRDKENPVYGEIGYEEMLLEWTTNEIKKVKAFRAASLKNLFDADHGWRLKNLKTNRKQISKAIKLGRQL